jgi:competence protein ComFA
MDELGRQIAISKKDLPTLSDTTMVREALDVDKGQCQRCGSLFAQEKHFLPNGNYYCVACLQFGRLTNEDVLLSKEDSDYQQRKV